MTRFRKCAQIRFNLVISLLHRTSANPAIRVTKAIVWPGLEVVKGLSDAVFCHCEHVPNGNWWLYGPLIEITKLR